MNEISEVKVSLTEPKRLIQNATRTTQLPRRHAALLLVFLTSSLALRFDRAINETPCIILLVFTKVKKKLTSPLVSSFHPRLSPRVFTHPPQDIGAVLETIKGLLLGSEEASALQTGVLVYKFKYRATYDVSWHDKGARAASASARYTARERGECKHDITFPSTSETWHTPVTKNRELSFIRY
jgi:hypothetical protein